MPFLNTYRSLIQYLSTLYVEVNMSHTNKKKRKKKEGAREGEK